MDYVTVAQATGVEFELITWIKNHAFETHLAAFLLMGISSAGLYLAAQINAMGLIWILLGLAVTGNVIVLVVR